MNVYGTFVNYFFEEKTNKVSGKRKVIKDYYMFKVIYDFGLSIRLSLFKLSLIYSDFPEIFGGH